MTMTDDEMRSRALVEYFELKRKCAKMDAEALKEKRPHSMRMAELQEYLSKTIRVGGIESLKVAEAGTVSVVQKTNYVTENRSALDEWILAPILNDLSEKKRRIILERIGFFSKALAAEPCKEYRMASGAKPIKGTTRIKGGEVPPGIKITSSAYLAFKEAPDENLENE